VVEATAELVSRGVRHVNVNMGCPWGRMTPVLSGGGMFRAPETVAPMLCKLRTLVPGSLSVKTRTGIDDERQIFDVLPAFVDAGVDFVVVHSRTVQQQYRGCANHDLTAEIVQRLPIPVVANGDVRTPEDAQRVMEQTGAAGLMLGRGAIADPMLFRRIRGEAPAAPDDETRQAELARVWSRLLAEYAALFAGDAQVLSKLRSVVKHAEHPGLRSWLKMLKKARGVADAERLLRVG
jgi:tRNA-dihydrouridine synthase